MSAVVSDENFKPSASPIFAGKVLRCLEGLVLTGQVIS